MKTKQDKKIILDTLNNKFNVEKETKNQLKNDNNLKDFYKHITENINPQKNKEKLKSYDNFINIFFDYLTSNDDYNIELLSGTQEQDNYYYNELSYFNDNITEQETSDLKKFIKLNNDNELYKMFNFECIDTDYLIENLKYIFNWNNDDYDTFTDYCSSYDGQLYLTDLKDFLNIENLNDEVDLLYNQLEKNEIDKDDLNNEIERIQDEIIDSIYNNIKPICNLIIADYLNLIDFSIDYKTITKLEQETLKNVVIELKNRKDNLIKEIKLKELEQEKLNKTNLKTSVKLLNNHINNLKTELNEIQELIKSEELKKW